MDDDDNDDDGDDDNNVYDDDNNVDDDGDDNIRGDEWSLRAFASMPSTGIFLRARAEIKNLLCELASNAKIWGARASEHSFKFCEQIEQR